MKKIQLNGHNYYKGIKRVKGWALVDDSDFEYLNQWKWSLSRRGYIVRREKIDGKSKMIKMHRQIMKTPEHLSTDHVNGNPLDNQRKNLRICTHSQNIMNSKIRKDNKSGVRGVDWDKARQKWHSRICVDQNKINLGCFVDKEEAIVARKKAELKYFGEFAYC